MLFYNLQLAVYSAKSPRHEAESNPFRSAAVVRRQPGTAYRPGFVTEPATRGRRFSYSCQLLAQTTHDYMFTKKGGKPVLEHARQGVQRVKLDTDQPSMLPAQHAGHRGHFLQQTH